MVINLPKFTSHHNSIILKFNGLEDPYKQRPFRFIHMWFRYNSYLELIYDSWRKWSNAQGLGLKKIEHLAI